MWFWFQFRFGLWYQWVVSNQRLQVVIWSQCWLQFQFVFVLQFWFQTRFQFWLWSQFWLRLWFQLQSGFQFCWQFVLQFSLRFWFVIGLRFWFQSFWFGFQIEFRFCFWLLLSPLQLQVLLQTIHNNICFHFHLICLYIYIKYSIFFTTFWKFIFYRVGTINCTIQACKVEWTHQTWLEVVLQIINNNIFFLFVFISI